MTERARGKKSSLTETPRSLRMNVLTMAALAGWILMVPPEPDSTLPISKWKALVTFDTAKECEADLAGSLLSAKETNTPSAIAVFRQGRCVPAEHVYPPAPAGTPPP